MLIVGMFRQETSSFASIRHFNEFFLVLIYSIEAAPASSLTPHMLSAHVCRTDFQIDLISCFIDWDEVSITSAVTEQ